MHQSEEFLENPRDNRLRILKGLNHCCGVGLKTRSYGIITPDSVLGPKRAQ